MLIRIYSLYLRLPPSSFSYSAIPLPIIDSFEASFFKSIFDDIFSFILLGDKDGIIADQPDSVLSLSKALMKTSILLNSSISRSGSIFTSFGTVSYTHLTLPTKRIV